MIFVICLLTMFSKKIRVAYPIVLVVAGLALSFVPSLPKISINPELIFIAILPPLLYEAALGASWKDLYRWRRIISGFAFVVVFVTACAVALIASHFIPGFSIALGFLLGGIVSPPDAVSAQAIMKFVKVPKRFSTIIEGESLFNDASSLIIMKFALIAIGTGQFVWYEAAGSFVWMIAGGVGMGILVAWLLKKFHELFNTDVNIDVVFTLIIPYVMYLSAEAVGASGVISVVSGGLYMNCKNFKIYNSSSRLSARNVWSNFGFLLNGFVFLLIGLDLPEITAAIESDGISIATATGYGLLITAALIVIRLLCSYGAMGVTMIMRNFINVADPNFYGMKGPLLLGWSGMRGVVSLAAALSIPLTITSQGWPFPQRSLIIYITFIVILLTLLIQGLTLPILIKHTHFPDFHDHMSKQKTDELIRKGMAKVSLEYIKANTSCANVHESELLRNMVRHWQEQVEADDSLPVYGTAAEIYVQILHAQRDYLFDLNKRHPDIDEDIIRHYQYRIDLEEERMKNE